MKLLALTLPGGKSITAPGGLPSYLSGGLYTSGRSIIQTSITLLFVFGILLTIIFIIYAGIEWILSGGDKEKIQKARARITYTLIGLLVLVASFFIVQTIIFLLGGNPDYFLNTTP